MQYVTSDPYHIAILGTHSFIVLVCGIVQDWEKIGISLTSDQYKQGQLSLCCQVQPQVNINPN